MTVPVSGRHSCAIVSGAPFTNTFIQFSPRVLVMTPMRWISDEKGNCRSIATSNGVCNINIQLFRNVKWELFDLYIYSHKESFPVPFLGWQTPRWIPGCSLVLQLLARYYQTSQYLPRVPQEPDHHFKGINC